jgi:hypothetical protein
LLREERVVMQDLRQWINSSREALQNPKVLLLLQYSRET